ncbi:MAG: hypothetical protein AAF456_18005 [Planctomycetota bacterium]
MKLRTKIWLLYGTGVLIWFAAIACVALVFLVPPRVHLFESRGLPANEEIEPMLTPADFEQFRDLKLQGPLVETVSEETQEEPDEVVQTPVVEPVSLPRSIDLGGVLYSTESESLALFARSGRWIELAVGETIDGATIKMISRDHVVLEYKEQEFKLFVQRQEPR